MKPIGLVKNSPTNTQLLFSPLDLPNEDFE